MENNKWTFKFNESDIWNEQMYDSKEEAIEMAKEQIIKENLNISSFYIGNFQVPSHVKTIYAKDILNNISMNTKKIYKGLSEEFDNYLDEVDPKHVAELEIRMRKIINEWMQEFNYEPKNYVLWTIEEVEI